MFPCFNFHNIQVCLFRPCSISVFFFLNQHGLCHKAYFMIIKQLFPSSSFCVGSLMDFKCPFPFKERRNSGARFQLSVEQPLMVRAASSLWGGQRRRAEEGLMLTSRWLASSLVGMVNNKLITFSGRRKMRWGNRRNYEKRYRKHATSSFILKTWVDETKEVCFELWC